MHFRLAKNTQTLMLGGRRRPTKQLPPQSHSIPSPTPLHSLPNPTPLRAPSPTPLYLAILASRFWPLRKLKNGGFEKKNHFVVLKAVLAEILLITTVSGVSTHLNNLCLYAGISQGFLKCFIDSVIKSVDRR